MNIFSTMKELILAVFIAYSPTELIVFSTVVVLTLMAAYRRFSYSRRFFSFQSSLFERKPSLENHVLIQKLGEWLRVDIPSLDLSDEVRGLLNIKFSVWSDEMKSIANHDKMNSLSNLELHEYITTRINKTTDLCKGKFKEAGIPDDIVDEFTERHDTSTVVVAKGLKHIVFDDINFPSNLLKVSVFFTSAIISFDLAIKHATEIDMKMK